MKNKVLRFFIALITALNALTFGAVAETEKEIAALGIFPQSVIQATADSEILRSEFAYMAAKILQSGEIRPSGTAFADVDADNIYSGYIKFLADANIIKGNGNSRFLPDESIRTIEAYKITIDLLGLSGYASIEGSWEDNYLRAANTLGLSKGVVPNENGILTKRAAEKLISNVLFTNFPGEQIYESDGQYQVQYSNREKSTILAERFGISVYEGTVGKVDITENSAEFTVSENVYDTNPQMRNEGYKISLEPKNGISLYEYEYMPATVWIRNTDELVYISFSGNVELKYGYILSVNGDSDVDAKYSPDFITRITVENDKKEYRVADDATIVMNREPAESPVALAQRFAKIVMIDGKVAYIEGWDLVEGGIITGIMGGEIKYTTGERVQATIEDYDQCTERLFFIGDRRADESELKTNSLFYYYVKDEFSIIVASEKIVTDEFVSTSNGSVNIGGIHYDTDHVYYSEDGERYKLNENAEKLYGMVVNGYVAPNGNILYVKPEKGQVNRSEFIGVVCGVSEEDFFGTERDIVLWSLAGDNPQKEVYKITEKTGYEDEITIDTLIQNARNYEGKGIFKFTVNGKGVVTKVSKLSPFYGFGDGRAVVTTTYLHGANRAYLTVNGKRLYFDQSKITSLYDDNGEFAVKQLTWADIRERTSATGFTFEFFGEELESIPSLVLLTGDTKTIGSAGIQAGFVTDIGKALDDEGNAVYVADVQGRNGKVQYTISDEIAKTLPSRAIILFTHSLKFSNAGLHLWAVADISGDYEDWGMSSCNVGNSWVGRGVVKKYDGIRLYLEDGTAEFVNNNPAISCFDGSSREPLTFGKTQYDVKPGDSVFYMVYDGTITDIVYIKD